MSSQAGTNTTIREEQLVRLEQAQALVQELELDLTTRQGEQQASDILTQFAFPQYLVYALQHPPITEDAIRWAEQRLTELKASGDVP